MKSEQRQVKVRKNVKAFKERQLEYIRSQKNKPCVDCKVSYPFYVMDFDHRDGESKSFNVGDMHRLSASKKRIDEEIAKCDLVCANCHRIRTYNRVNMRD